MRTPSYLARRALRSGLFPKTDPSLREATRETLASLSRGDVRSYYEKVFRPDLTTIVVIGQITPGQARTTIEKYFGGWKAVGPRFDPDYYPLQVGTNVLAGAFYATRLYRHLREEAGLVYFVGARFNAERTRSVFSVNFACEPENVSKARAMVVRDLEAMRTQLVSPSELRQAKNILLRRIALSESSMDSIAATLSQLSTQGLPLDEPVRAAKRYLEITAPEVRDSFFKWIRPADIVQVTEGPPPE